MLSYLSYLSCYYKETRGHLPGTCVFQPELCGGANQEVRFRDRYFCQSVALYVWHVPHTTGVEC